MNAYHPPRRAPYRRRNYPLGRFLLLIAGLFLIYNCVMDPSSETPSPVEELAKTEEQTDTTAVDTNSQQQASPPLKQRSDTPPLWDDPAYLATQPDTTLGRIIGQLLERHHPDGAFWMMSRGSDNQLLAWGQYSDSSLQRHPDFAARTTFPAASIAKIVTAAAAFESRQYTPESTKPLVGRSTTLYNRQLKVRENEGTPITLTHAFARSMNPPMALLGQEIGTKKLQQAAAHLGFNLEFPRKLPHRSHYAPPDSGYGLAEVACGFTKQTTLSPLQASGMAYTVYSGKAWRPAWSPNGPKNGFPDGPLSPAPPLHHETLQNLRTLFEATATNGTSRTALRKTIYPIYKPRVQVGGKTGSLDGKDPWGRYDWFVGYAYDKKNPDNGVILTIMQYHRRIRSLPSSQVAGVLINHWAKYYIDQTPPPLPTSAN